MSRILITPRSEVFLRDVQAAKDDTEEIVKKTMVFEESFYFRPQRRATTPMANVRPCQISPCDYFS